MIQNIQKYSALKGMGLQDALQVFMQVIWLKNIRQHGIALIGGTALVLAENNPRFSEDIDLTGLDDPARLLPDLKRASTELEAFLGSESSLKSPKKGRTTWKIACRLPSLAASIHIDGQEFKPFTKRPLMVEFPGVPPFVFPGVKIEESMADKLLALAFRNNLSGRDIFDLWFHWFRHGLEGQSYPDITVMLREKLNQRAVDVGEFNNAISLRLKDAIPARVIDEWNRYLPTGLKNSKLFEDIFETTKLSLEKIKL